jgi:hypothetical protein
MVSVHQVGFNFNLTILSVQLKSMKFQSVFNGTPALFR